MTGAPLSALRPVYVAGIGMHPYQFPSETPYVRLGITAVRAALADAGLAWPEVEAAYVGTTGIGMAAGRILFRHLGSTGLAVTQVENASASGSAAFRLACLEVASGRSDVALALGVDKFGDAKRAAMKDGIERLSDTAHVPAVKFALLARAYCREYGATPDDLARVAVKNTAMPRAILSPSSASRARSSRCWHRPGWRATSPPCSAARAERAQPPPSSSPRRPSPA
jgi:acetyl-CoA acetyltransferase